MVDLYKRAYDVAKQENLWRSVKPLDVLCQDFCSELSVKFDPFELKDGVTPTAYRQGLGYLLRIGCGAPLNELIDRGIYGQNDIDGFNHALEQGKLASDKSPQLSYGMRVACNAITKVNWSVMDGEDVLQKYLDTTGAKLTDVVSPRRSDTIASIRMGFFYVVHGILREHYDEIPTRYGFQNAKSDTVRRSKRVISNALSIWKETEGATPVILTPQFQAELILQ